MKAFFTTIKAFFNSLTADAPVAQVPTSCGNINALLLHLCDFDYELHMWVLRWLAYPLRNPGAKLSTCILVNGGDRDGKSMFFADVMAELYGDTARQLRPAALQPRALEWAKGAEFVVIDGRYSDASLGHLKHLVTDSALYAVAAHKRAASLHPNRMNFVFLTGEIDFLPTDVANRRFVVIEAPPARQPKFYLAARFEIENGGAEAFRDYLMRGIDMADFNATTPPPVARMREVA
jgi:hypothetical protein